MNTCLSESRIDSATQHQQAYSWTADTGVALISPNVKDYPDNQTLALGINNNGQVVGYLANQHVGFVGFPGKKGDFPDTFNAVTVPVPNFYTIAGGINDTGQIIGNFSDPAGFHGFVLTPPLGVDSLDIQ